MFFADKNQYFPIRVYRVYLDVYLKNSGINWERGELGRGHHFDEREMSTKRDASQITKALKAVQKAVFGAFCFSISEELCGCEKVGKVVNFLPNLRNTNFCVPNEEKGGKSMKNLKKVLSLVLALAMALSLMTVAFAADASDYKDYDKVTHKEAVDVMTAVGVFNGTGDGSNFSPDGTLTREQAAKIITYMLVGQEQADKLTATVAPYSDVAASRWSAGAIAYCTNEGILAGTGNGKFNPTGELTGLEFAKMLLVALGYDATIEQLTGGAWAINTSKLALGDVCSK